MTWVTGVVVYLIVWWLVLFMVLPWGVRVPDEPEEGHATSAPVRPRLLIKFAATTVIAGIVWGIVFWLVQSDLISFRPN